MSVAVSRGGAVATILIDRADKLNALTLDMLRQLEWVCEEIDRSPARVVLVRTAGTRVFCVGADITHFAGISAVQMWREWVATGHRAFARLASLRQPTIAVVDGLAVGGGFELALACDLRIVAQHAKVALPEGGLGTVPGWGGTERLTELAGRARAKELVFTRRQLTADEAQQWGVANLVVDAAEIDDETSRLVSEILLSAPVAIQLAKQIIDAAADGAASSVLEALASGVAAGTDDLIEGTNAFREKRAARFTDS
ncbi:enoyl-CoA hydratase/isomerase family protein [Microcella alkaliphila]|uniref:enoyl-CoA hydratase/isomerase family protein n=1 Tax=Microcella alkaliphila TaxID=279828 RepID=UPI001E547603|nr:enoyl-CoA hydratase/isomerase family protein [Microcella alkaliphila]